jgi:hypothetical protein
MFWLNYAIHTTFCPAGEKVLNAGNAVNADASVMSWMLNRKASANKGKDAKR